MRTVIVASIVSTLIAGAIICAVIFFVVTNNHHLVYDVDKVSPPLQFTRPRNLFLTYTSKSLVPRKVWASLRTYAPEYTVRFFDDRDCENYIRRWFDASLLRRYQSLKRGAHRADLWRYCVLYREGGLYMDIKTVLVKPVVDIMPMDSNVTVLSSVPGTIYQGIINSPFPGNPVLRRCIQHIMATPQFLVDMDYLIFTRFMYNEICRQTHQRALHPGSNGTHSDVWVIMQEICDPQACTVLDRYNNCCYIASETGELCFHTRYHDFPWNGEKR